MVTFRGQRELPVMKKMVPMFVWVVVSLVYTTVKIYQIELKICAFYYINIIPHFKNILKRTIRVEGLFCTRQL